MSVVSYGNLLILFNSCAMNLLAFEKEFKVILKKDTYFIYIFYDLEGRVSFAYVPVRDQNLVVRGRNSV